MKTAALHKSTPRAKSKVKFRPADGLHFMEVGGGGGPASDARDRLAAFYAKYPRRSLKRGERGVVAGLKSDRDRR
jgi:hypothetical protein